MPLKTHIYAMTIQVSAYIANDLNGNEGSFYFKKIDVTNYKMCGQLYYINIYH